MMSNGHNVLKSVILVLLLLYAAIGAYGLWFAEPPLRFNTPEVEPAVCPVPAPTATPLPTPEVTVCATPEFAPETELRLSCRQQDTALREAWKYLCFPQGYFLGTNENAACEAIQSALLDVDCEYKEQSNG